jgi:hypothetical protein
VVPGRDTEDAELFFPNCVGASYVSPLSNYGTHAQSAALVHTAFRLTRPMLPTFDVRLPLNTAPLRTTASGGTKLRNRVNYFGLYSGKSLGYFSSSFWPTLERVFYTQLRYLRSFSLFHNTAYE